MKNAILLTNIANFQRGIQLSISPNYGIKIVNSVQGVTLTLSGCGTQASLIHPCGRVYQYGSRIEAHTRDDESHFMEKNAKIWPRGISFTSNTCALIYLVDEAGARSTSDFFHNLYAEDITDSK